MTLPTPVHVSSSNGPSPATQESYGKESADQRVSNILFRSTAAQVNIDIGSPGSIDAGDEKVQAIPTDTKRRQYELPQSVSGCDAQEAVSSCHHAAPNLIEHAIEKTSQKEPDLLARLEAAEQNLRRTVQKETCVK